MTDTDKVNVIRDILVNAWQAVPEENADEFWTGIVLGIESVVNAGVKTDA